MRICLLSGAFLGIIIKGYEKIAIFSCKGGVDKSTVTAGLAQALGDKGLRVGCLDIDISLTSLHKAFLLQKPPKLGVDTVNKR
ncbi:MAG: hypothetical protein COS88_00660 [Chloroflexi bacterium CG07_land_8_20_14_0_80_51_10]|nr:MAG: hypothetical protein COS88_00660 [Chloroflexi bacterium CG07_land_8_20_14_0_80_51_10]